MGDVVCELKLFGRNLGVHTAEHISERVLHRIEPVPIFGRPRSKIIALHLVEHIFDS
jgi:hypothetical protein